MAFDVQKYLRYFGFKRVKKVGENYMASCPDFDGLHPRGDMRPSFGIRVYPPYLSHCFTCNLRMNIEQLTATLLSREYDRRVNEYEAWKWLEDKGWVVTLTAEDLKHRLQAGLDGGEALDILDEDILNDFINGVHQSIIDRGITKEAAKEWELKYDSKTKRTIIPVRNFMGLLVGVLSRAVNEEEYIRHGVGIPQPAGGIKYQFKKGLVLYGEHKLQGKETLLLTESPLDAVYCWSYGIQKDMDIMALMGTKASKTQIEKILDYPEVIIAMDNDAPGKEGKAQLFNVLKGKVRLKVFDNFGRKDIGEVDPIDLQKIKQVSKSTLSEKINKLQKIP